MANKISDIFIRIHNFYDFEQKDTISSDSKVTNI